jgi:hypothetical protein
VIADQPTERLVGFAQVALSIVFVAGYFAALFAVIAGWIRTPPDYKEALLMLFSALTTVLALVMNFWFSRSRPQGVQA